MNLTLAMSTSTPQVSLALSGEEGILSSFSLRAGRRHAETLAPAIDALFRISGTDIGSLRRVAVDVGPGLFTGLRVGVSTAKALGHALGIPVVTAGSLEILAFACRHDRRPVASVVDARRGEVFWALHRTGPGGIELISGPAVATPSRLAEVLAATVGPVLVTGDGARRYMAELSPLGDRIEVAPELFDHPSADQLAVMSAGLEEIQAALVTPRYMREADVRIGWDQR